MDISKIYLSIFYLCLRVYVKSAKVSGIQSLINKSDVLFRIYVIPHRFYHTLRRRANSNFAYTYIWDVISKRHLKYRKGECKCCGSCCGSCLQLMESNGKKLCKIYTRREGCDVYFPISKCQLEYITQMHNLKCGFYFDK